MEKNNDTTEDRVKKVVVIGPESTGKSVLSATLATYYNTVWVPEYARDYIARLDRPYEERDLLKIANGQLATEDALTKKANRVLICDTDLVVIKVWALHKYGACYDEILAHIKERKYDLYLLTYIDIPWENDPQRENPHLRAFFYNIFKKELETHNAPFVEIKGEFYERKRTAVKAIDQLLSE